MIRDRLSSDNEILEKLHDLAFQNEKEFHGCAQSLLAAVQDVLGMADESVFKCATGLAGGIGISTKGTCGALIGGVMFLNLRYGRERKNISDPERIRFKSYQLARRLQQKFIQEYGSPICHEIQEKIFGRSYKLYDPAEFQEFERAGGHDDKCTEVVGKAARWVGEIFLKEEA